MKRKREILAQINKTRSLARLKKMIKVAETRNLIILQFYGKKHLLENARKARGSLNHKITQSSRKVLAEALTSGEAEMKTRFNLILRISMLRNNPGKTTQT